MTTSTKKRRIWTDENIRTLKKGARRQSVASIARYLRRTQGAVRQKAFSLGISLDTREVAA